MSYAEYAAIAYIVLVTLPVSMQLGVALGRPWGRLTMGGYWKGILPSWARGLALLQAGLLIMMGLAMLDASKLVNLGCPNWAYMASLTITGITFLANAMSPSLLERRLWTPVIALMLVMALVVWPT
ncbi:MAG: Unknown protein [uncultured Thiotrichaceae bacterium]|uniref:Uncharacterized protein n=1 Tax=uncultured Thiotrichaceae bacterium TaxID=298394 RepID=A0A6S6TKM7_9GAMM|nr:MAG: Unknown protein [uncultured Thiotrichaceae bacterium]